MKLHEEAVARYKASQLVQFGRKDVELFDHQKTGIEFLKSRKRAILADEMGLGKTRQAIVAAREESDGILVVCPASLKINWKREILSVYPDDRVRIISTTDLDPTFGPGWYIVNYDILEKKIDTIEGMVASGVSTLILDEAHYIKGKSIRAAVVTGGKIKRKSTGTQSKFDGISGKMERVYCLTGTPILNRPIEMFNLLKAINHPLSGNRSWFAKRYCGAYLKTVMRRAPNPPIRYVDESGATNLGELREMLSGQFLRRKKKEVLNLPPKIISIMECELDDGWRKKYDTAFDSYLEFLMENPPDMEEGEFEKKIDGILTARHLVEVQKVKQVVSLAKLARIASDIRDAVEEEQKVIVFSQYTNTISELKKTLESSPIKDGPPIRVVTLTGADDVNARQEAVDRFQKEKTTQVFIANIKAGGVGLTLTEASIVMFADMEWSPEIHAQAEDRAHRIGQEGTVNVYYYIASDTIEEDILSSLNDKKNIMNQILEGKKISKKSESVFEGFLRSMGQKVTNRQV